MQGTHSGEVLQLSKVHFVMLLFPCDSDDCVTQTKIMFEKIAKNNKCAKKDTIFKLIKIR